MSKKICGVCFTDSWQPCPEGTPEAIKDDNGGFMVCGYCRLEEALGSCREAFRHSQAEVTRWQDRARLYHNHIVMMQQDREAVIQ